MANFTLKTAAFPVGTNVNAYARAKFPASPPVPSGPLPGGIVADAGPVAVATDQSIPFTGLSAGPYVCYANVGGTDTYVQFVVPGATGANERVTVQGATAMARGIGDSLNAGGRVVAPAGGAAIATTGAGTTGAVYEIFVTVAIGAGGAAADAGNVQLQEGATVLAVLAAAAPGSQTFGPFRRTNSGAAAYSVNAVGAGTAAVPYAATIAATRIE